MLLLGGPAPALGQGLSAEERQAAAEAAYDRGSQAFRGGDYPTAARWYETANELAPSANALIQAMRSHQRAGNHQRAGTLALDLIDRYGERMERHARPVVDEVAPTAVRVDVTCDGCSLVVDGEAEGRRSFFLRPDTDHLIVARFESGDVEDHVMGGPGEQRELTFEPPAVEGDTDGGADDVTAPFPDPDADTRGGRDTGGRGGGDPRPVEPSGGISPVFAIVGSVLTVGAGAALAWSGLDTLDARDDYEQAPTRQKLEDGRDLELRTNILIGATAGLGALTILFLALTDFGGEEEGTEAALVPLPEGGVALSARGPLP